MIYYPNQINSEDERRGIINYYVWITGFNQDVYRYSTDRGRSACNKKIPVDFPQDADINN